MASPDPLDRWNIRHLFYLTHHQNLWSIARYGVLSHRRVQTLSAPVADISDPDVQDRRRNRYDPIHKQPLHTYVPLYFQPRNPMLFVRKERQDQLVVLCLGRELLKEPSVVFTDGNAASDGTSFFTEIADLDRLDWKCIRAEFWTDFEDGKRKRCAEILVPDRIPPEWICSVAVSSEDLRGLLAASACPWEVEIRPEFFFVTS